MSRIAPTIVLSPEEQQTLESWSRSGKTEQRVAFRAKIILRAARGLENGQIAAELGTRPATITKWRRRFHRERLLGLQDASRPGAVPKYDEKTERCILAMLDEPPPRGYATWTGPLLAKALGDVSDDHVWRVLRKHGISLARRRSWCISTDPEFAPKAAAIIGLYLNPPKNGVVLCMDEKTGIQALERAQGWLRLPNGKALTGFNHEYKRHGTTTLFVALETATGLVKVGHYKRRRRREFLDFMNEVVTVYKEQEIHVILDNLNIHKPKEDRWLKRHPNVHFHFTPTHASWLNQVEIFLSLLWRSALRGASFTSPRQVRQAINRFIEAYNPISSPFEWKATDVYPTAPKHKYADLCK